MKSWIRTILILAVPFLIAACDQNGNLMRDYGLEKLSKGVSTEADVLQTMGQPDTVWEEDDGERTLEYPKGPMGTTTWFVFIGADGKFRDYKQVLTEANFANIKVGMTQDRVRKILGKQRTVVQFKRKNEEVWDWRYISADTSQRFFNVHFDITSGLVTGTSSSDAFVGGR
ncbi:outer membrane protein assembly factor BamE domain-containing protein [Glaciimonas soli]|uniref:Outer membrane protein assembly factor BamE n=1 Tax=Glaciimonas soli TaxID=2590999 RepID=A0A843YJK1_9BURK|nr:outer membrane protein assembly factor BamE [Glaciimonas soli]MQQ99958.1 outer membrane protein assembly factor BamE [Glaciimonas soli]